MITEPNHPPRPAGGLFLDPIRYPGRPKKLRLVSLNFPFAHPIARLSPRPVDSSMNLNPLFKCEVCQKTRKLEKMNQLLANPPISRTVCDKCVEDQGLDQLALSFKRLNHKEGLITLTKSQLNVTTDSHHWNSETEIEALTRKGLDPEWLKKHPLPIYHKSDE